MTWRTLPFCFLLLGMLTGCISGQRPADSYNAPNGETKRIESDQEQCTRSCNQSYSVCMESYAAQNSGVNGPQGMFGVSADCRNELEDCLPPCKAR